MASRGQPQNKERTESQHQRDAKFKNNNKKNIIFFDLDYYFILIIIFFPSSGADKAKTINKTNLV